MADHFILSGILFDENDILAKRNLEMGREVLKFSDSECLRLCEELVPFDQGTLAKSGIINTQIGSGEVKYRTPYARRWYFMPANFQEAPRRGNYWFERMKQNGGKDQILAGARKLAGV